MYIIKGLNTSFNALKALSKLGLHATQLYPRSDILSYAFICRASVQKKGARTELGVEFAILSTLSLHNLRWWTECAEILLTFKTLAGLKWRRRGPKLCVPT